MIANNEHGRATEVTPPVVIATAGRGAVNHSEQGNYPRPLGATPLDVTWQVTMLHEPGDFDRLLDDIRAHDGEPLICPCHGDPYGNGPCIECRAEIDAMLVRRGLKPSASGYFVDSRDGEARDEPEDVS